MSTVKLILNLILILKNMILILKLKHLVLTNSSEVKWLKLTYILWQDLLKEKWRTQGVKNSCQRFIWTNIPNSKTTLSYLLFHTFHHWCMGLQNMDPRTRNNSQYNLHNTNTDTSALWNQKNIYPFHYKYFHQLQLDQCNL